MKLINAPQGSPDWLQARAGAVTASKFREALEMTVGSAKTPARPTSKSELYCAQVAIERVSGAPCEEGFNSWQMERGSALEAAARMEYEARTSNLASESGVVKTDDDTFGYSTDGFVDDDGIIEIKCPASAIKIIAMWDTGDVSEYIHQIQGGMWITGRKWCDFVMYCPQLEPIGKQLYVKRIARDEAFIEQLEIDLLAFNRRVEANVAILTRGNEVDLKVAA